MTFLYNIDTTLGPVPRYDNETNIALMDLYANQYLTVAVPSQTTVSDGNAVLWYPVSGLSVGSVMTADGSETSSETLPIGQMVSPGIFLMEPVDASVLSNPPPGAVIQVVNIGLAPIVIIAICIAIVAIAGALAVVGTYFSKAWAEVHYQEAQEAYYNYLIKTMEVVEDYTTDLNGDGIQDVRYIVWANGRSVAFALSDYGTSQLGGSYNVLDKGTTAPPPEAPSSGFSWDIVIIGVAAVIGLIVLLKIVKD